MTTNADTSTLQIKIKRRDAMIRSLLQGAYPFIQICVDCGTLFAPLEPQGPVERCTRCADLAAIGASYACETCGGGTVRLDDKHYVRQRACIRCDKDLIAAAEALPPIVREPRCRCGHLPEHHARPGVTSAACRVYRCPCTSLDCTPPTPRNDAPPSPYAYADCCFVVGVKPNGECVVVKDRWDRADQWLTKQAAVKALLARAADDKRPLCEIVDEAVGEDVARAAARAHHEEATRTINRELIER